MVSWVLGSDSKLPAAADREAFARALQRWCFVQAQHFGGVVIGARKAGKLAGTMVVYPPGTVPGASNFGYALLGHLVSSIIVS